MKIIMQNEKGEDIDTIFASVKEVKSVKKDLSKLHLEIREVESGIETYAKEVNKEFHIHATDAAQTREKIQNLEATISELKDTLLKLQENQLSENNNFFKDVISTITGKKKKNKVEHSTVKVKRETK